MTAQEVSEIVYVKYDCANRAWATSYGEDFVWICANFCYSGTVRPRNWKDGEVVDTIDGVPVIFKRMDMKIGGPEDFEH